MSERNAYIAFTAAAVLLEVVGFVALKRMGADSETIAAAVLVLASAAGLGIGFLSLRYH
jgi:hypothetical protein